MKHMSRTLVVLLVLFALLLSPTSVALADPPSGQQGYDGQPGNQGNGSNGYQGRPGNQGGH